MTESLRQMICGWCNQGYFGPLEHIVAEVPGGFSRIEVCSPKCGDEAAQHYSPTGIRERRSEPPVEVTQSLLEQFKLRIRRDVMDFSKGELTALIEEVQWAWGEIDELHDMMDEWTKAREVKSRGEDADET